MSDGRTGLERFTALSDGIFAVIITIMVLDLRPPEQHDLRALLHLWPEVTSYTVSYLFIAVVWLNHHHVFGYATRLTKRPGAVEFRQSIRDFSHTVHDGMALVESRRRLPADGVRVGVPRGRADVHPADARDIPAGFTSSAQKRDQRVHFLRAWIMAAIFAFAAFAVFVPAGVRLALTATFLLLHLRPNLLRSMPAGPGA